jgi:hypothetical protein
VRKAWAARSAITVTAALARRQQKQRRLFEHEPPEPRPPMSKFVAAAPGESCASMR